MGGIGSVLEEHAQVRLRLLQVEVGCRDCGARTSPSDASHDSAVGERNLDAVRDGHGSVVSYLAVLDVRGHGEKVPARTRDRFAGDGGYPVAGEAVHVEGERALPFHHTALVHAREREVQPRAVLCTGFGQIAAGCADDEVHRVVLAAGSLEGCVSQALVARLVERHQADAGRRLSPHGRHVGGVVGGGGVSHLHPCHTRELLPRGEAAGGSGLGVRRAGVQGRRHRCVGCGIDPGRVVKAAATAPAEGDAGQDGQRNQDFAHRVLRCY